jgi:hypothetical protein
MEMPKPTPGHERLLALSGTWLGEEKMHPSPWDPNGGTATGKINSRVALDGLHLLSDYEQWRGGQVTYHGHGVYGFDVETDEAWFYWFDSMGFDPGSAARGKWVGTRLEFRHRTRMGGFSRYAYEFDGEDAFTFTIEMSGDGESYTPWLESRWTREEV